MGIPRLTSFVNNNFTGWQREEIKGKLVVDGFSLCFNLYAFDWSHGGQYHQYRDGIIHYFISMTQSGITPLVVLDGVDFKEQKMDTIMKRRNSAVKTVHRYTCGSQKRQREVLVDGVLPPLAYRVFLMVMVELNIQFIVADGEGDKSIYELANGYSCPVLSNDSDFLLYKLEGGYIPLNRFYCEATPVNGEVYHYQAFCSQMGFSDLGLRLAIPAIAGNDFLSPVMSDTFLAYMSVKSKEDGAEHRHPSISTVIHYISQFESLKKLLIDIQSIPCLGENDKDIIRKNCANVQDMYDSEETITLKKLYASTELLAFRSEELPEWILKQFRMGNFQSMGALVLGTNILDTFIDNSSAPSCVQASVLIRQFIYGLMGISSVTEICRERICVVRKNIHANTTIHGRALPSLRRIPTLSASEREDLLYSILSCAVDPLFLRFPGYWKLVLAATMFWARHCNPSPHQIKALILNFVVYATCSEEVPKMHEQFEIPFRFIHSPRWLPLLHIFSQWQSIYGDVVSLNQLLMLPLEPVSPAQLYDGKLVMFFALPENDDHMAGRLPVDHRLFDDLVKFVLPQSISHHGFQPRKAGSNIDHQPPRFRGLSLSSTRGGLHHQRGKGLREDDHSNRRLSSTREQVQERSQMVEARSYSRSRGGGGGGGSSRSYAVTIGGHGQVREFGKGSRDDSACGLHGTGHVGGLSRSSKGWKQPSRGTSRSGSAHAQVNVQPKFAHANRFSSLVPVDVMNSEENSSSD